METHQVTLEVQCEPAYIPESGFLRLQKKSNTKTQGQLEVTQDGQIPATRTHTHTPHILHTHTQSYVVMEGGGGRRGGLTVGGVAAKLSISSCVSQTFPVL